MSLPLAFFFTQVRDLHAANHELDAVYAVDGGKHPGVYATFAGAQEAVRLGGGELLSFATTREAQDFCAGTQPRPPPYTHIALSWKISPCL